MCAASGAASEVRQIRSPPQCGGTDRLDTGVCWVGTTPRHLLLTLGVLHNEAAGHAWASVEYLAFRLGVDKSTIKRTLSVLMNEEGLIVRSLRKGGWTTSRKTDTSGMSFTSDG